MNNTKNEINNPLDKHLDAILRAIGSELRYYNTTVNGELRAALLAAVAELAPASAEPAGELSDEQIDALWRKAQDQGLAAGGLPSRRFARDIIALHQAAAPQQPASAEPAQAVYLVATGETHEGMETYTRHGVRPLMCDAEQLYTAAPQPPAVQPAAPAAPASNAVCWIKPASLDLLKIGAHADVAPAGGGDAVPLVLGVAFDGVVGDAAMPRDTDEARKFLVKLFADQLSCHDFKAYIRCELAGDFAFVLSGWLVRQAVAHAALAAKDAELDGSQKLIDALHSRVAAMLVERGEWSAAIKTLQSERDANAMLVGELERMTTEHDAALAQLAEKPAQEDKKDMADAYCGAREDLEIWKRRALEAEEKLRAEIATSSRLVSELNSESGPSRMGEPLMVKLAEAKVGAKTSATLDDHHKKAVAGHIAFIVEGWVEGCIKDGKDWKGALPGIIERRLRGVGESGAQAGPVLLTDDQIDAVIDRPVNALAIVAHDKYGKRGALWYFAKAIEAAVHAANPVRADLEALHSLIRQAADEHAKGYPMDALEALVKAISQEGGAS